MKVHPEQCVERYCELAHRTVIQSLKVSTSCVDDHHFCEQYTHKYSTYKVAQHDHVSSREHAWLKGAKLGLHIFVSLKQLSSTCHVSFLALTTSTNSLSSTPPIFPTVSPAHTRLMVLDPYLPCDVPRQSDGSTQIPSLTHFTKDEFESSNFPMYVHNLSLNANTSRKSVDQTYFG